MTHPRELDEAESSDASQIAKVKPRWRGVTHEVAFYVMIPLVVAILASAPKEALPELPIYLGALLGLFGMSALFHRPTWTPRVRRQLRRLDHSMIFIVIAGSYTGTAGLALEGSLRTWILISAWTGAALGVTLKVAWLDAPKWLSATAYVALGWMAVVMAPQLIVSIGWIGFSMLVVGGICYTVGAIIFAWERPDPLPSVFGYHEIFHACVIGGALSHLAMVRFVVLPAI